MCGIAVSLFEGQNTIVGSLGVVVPAQQLTPSLLQRITTGLV